MSNEIDYPSHYNGGAIEVIDIIEDQEFPRGAPEGGMTRRSVGAWLAALCGCRKKSEHRIYNVRARIAAARKRLMEVRPLVSDNHLPWVNKALSILVGIEEAVHAMQVKARGGK